MIEFYRFIAAFVRDPKRGLAAQFLGVAGFALLSFLPAIYKQASMSLVEQTLILLSIVGPIVMAAWLLLAKGRSPKPPAKPIPPE